MGSGIIKVTPSPSLQLSIDFIGDVNYDEWNIHVGKIHSCVNAMERGEIYVSFEECTDCLPLFLASLFLTIVRKTKSVGNRVKTTIRLSSQQDSWGRTSHFFNLFREMHIMNICTENGIAVFLDGEEQQGEKDIGFVPESYPLYIINVKELDIKNFIDEKYDEFLSSSCSDSISANIKNIFYETILNIKEHAYPNNDSAYAAISLTKKTTNNSSLYKSVQKAYFHQAKTYYEIVVIDEGIGLTKSLNVTNKDGVNSKHPLELSVKQTFIFPHNYHYNRPRAKKSYYKGLEFVYKLLSENGDYVFIREQNEHVILQGGRSSSLTWSSEETFCCGLALCFTIIAEKSTDYSDISKTAPFLNGKNDALLAECQVRNELARKKSFDFIIQDGRPLFSFPDNIFVDNASDNSDIGKIIWLNNSTFSKNEITNKVYSLIEKENSKPHYLLIGDVNTSELPTYFYALKKLPFNNFKTYFDKIIVVSHSLRAQVFVAEKHSYRYSDEETIKYLSLHSENPFDSLLGYYRFITYYDSSIFWDKLFSKSNRNHLVVRGEIEWENQLFLQYYLNLELILCNRDLYEIIKHFLIRISGFLKEECIYKNTDILMQKMCIDLNHSIQKTQAQSTIYIESVYVTGKTDAIVNASQQDLKVSLFVNYFNNPNAKEGIYSLLLWPQKEILDKNLTPWSGKIRRRHDTHSILLNCDDPSKKIELTHDSNSTLIRNHDETLQDIHDLFGGFILVGHFQYHSNHDLFAINQHEIIKTSYYEQRGIFTYALQILMDSVGKNFIDNLNDEWKSDGKINTENCKDGLMFFRMHYYTNFLFEKLNKCFTCIDCHIWDSVIPLESLKKKQGNLPLLISDLSLDNITEQIKKKYQENKECNITLFDTLCVSGKTFSDMHSIINQAVTLAKKTYPDLHCNINEAVLFDCSTYTVFRTNLTRKAYYHFDFPRLGTSEYCPLCSLLNNAERSKELLHSELAKKRIDSWIEIWSAVSPLFNHGINIQRRSSQKRSFLYRIVELVESAYSNYNLSYLYQFYLSNKENLDLEEKLLILSFQILLFPQKDNYKNYNDIYSELFTQFETSETTNEATALVAILCINANKVTACNSIRKIKVLMNEDIRIVYAILCGQYKELNGSPLFNDVSDILKLNATTDIDLIKQFHSLLYNDYGSDHKTRIDKLKMWINSPTELHKYCILAYYCLEKMDAIINSLNPLVIRSDSSVSKNYPQTKEKTKALEAISYGKHFIDKVLEIIDEENIPNLSSQLKEELTENVINPIKEFHQKLFIRYGKENSQVGRDIANSIISIMKHASEDSDTTRPSTIEVPSTDNHNVCYYYDAKNNRNLKYFLEDRSAEFPDPGDNICEVWYLWTQNIIDELQYLFADVRHSTGDYVKQDTLKDLNMVVRFRADNNKLLLTLTSTSNNSSRDIENSLSEKHRYQRESLIKYNVKIDYSTTPRESGDGYDLTTTVFIPAI